MPPTPLRSCGLLGHVAEIKVYLWGCSRFMTYSPTPEVLWPVMRVLQLTIRLWRIYIWSIVFDTGVIKACTRFQKGLQWLWLLKAHMMRTTPIPVTVSAFETCIQYGLKKRRPTAVRTSSIHVTVGTFETRRTHEGLKVTTVTRMATARGPIPGTVGTFQAYNTWHGEGWANREPASI